MTAVEKIIEQEGEVRISPGSLVEEIQESINMGLTYGFTIVDSDPQGSWPDPELLLGSGSGSWTVKILGEHYIPSRFKCNLVNVHRVQSLKTGTGTYFLEKKI
jgi:hypothetical protein